MGNNCCQKPDDEQVLKTFENDKKEADRKNDKYPHDSDSAFKSIKKEAKKNDIKHISSGNIIEE